MPVFIGWVTNVLKISLAVGLLFNKRYFSLRFVSLFLFGSTVVSIAYKSFFYNWYFFLFSVMVQAVLFALAYWEVMHKLEGRNAWWFFIAIGAVVLVPIMPVSFVLKTSLPFIFVNLLVAIHASFAFSRKNPFLIIWTTTSSWGLAIGGLEVFASKSEALVVMGSYSVWTSFLATSALVLTVVWLPMLRWLYRQISAAVGTPVAAPAVAGSGFDRARLRELREAENVVAFPTAAFTNVAAGSPESSPYAGFAEAMDDYHALTPAIENAAMMMTLNYKPYLSLRELMFYLDLAEGEVDVFLERHGMRKLYILDDDERWVVKREEIDKLI